MIERLKQIIKYYNLSSSTFAETINVPKSSISHLLSGRNKPSLDFVIKVVDNFNEVELEWLVYGKGTFPKSVKEEKKEITKPTPTTPTLFSEIENKELETANSIKNKLSAKRIIILNENGTFEEFTRE